MKVSFKVFSIKPHKLFAEESGTYDRILFNGFYLLEADPYEIFDTYEKAVDSITRMKSESSDYNSYTILPIYT